MNTTTEIEVVVVYLKADMAKYHKVMVTYKGERTDPFAMHHDEEFGSYEWWKTVALYADSRGALETVAKAQVKAILDEAAFG